MGFLVCKYDHDILVTSFFAMNADRSAILTAYTVLGVLMAAVGKFSVIARKSVVIKSTNHLSPSD